MKYAACFRDKTVLVVDPDIGDLGYYNLRQLTKLIASQDIDGVVASRGVLMEVVPCQPVEHKSALQAKTSLIKNIDISVYNGIVTNIRMRKIINEEPRVIRLSDFGTSCADYIFSGNRFAFNSHILTLVLDDKIKYTKNSFRLYSFVDDEVLTPFSINAVGVHLDLRDVSSDSLATIAYKSVITNKAVIEVGTHSIIDSPERKSRMLDIIQADWRSWESL